MPADREGIVRRTFLCLGIGFTLFGCLIAALGIAMPGWQVLDLTELNAVHEHAIFYDCVRSEVTPLDRLGHRLEAAVSSAPSRRCTYKFDPGGQARLEHSIRMAMDDGDFAAREHLNHRFLPQHKAVIFYSVFMLAFALLSVLVGICSPCFLPNGVLHVISVGLATSCSVLADIYYFMASQRDGNRLVQGNFGTYQQHLSYAFFVHCLGSLTFVLALLCSSVAAYLLLARECRAMWIRRKKRSRSRRNYADAEVESLAEQIEERFKKSVLLSNILRPRPSTVQSYQSGAEEDFFSMDNLPPPPPTPQLQLIKNRQWRVSFCCAAPTAAEEQPTDKIRAKMLRKISSRILMVPKRRSCSAV